MKNNYIGRSIIATVVFAGVLSGCRSDFDYEEAKRQNPEYAYRENFEKAFGTISPTQSWDFSSGRTTISATRAELDPTVTTGDWYEVDNATLGWMKNKLVEGKDNRSLGKSFVMTMPGNSFTIVPIYQGNASMVWDLHLVIGTGADAVDQKIWSKNEYLEVGTENYGGGISWKNVKDAGGNTMSAQYVRAYQYTVDKVPVGTEMYFYLEIKTGASGWANKGTKQSSLAGMMLLLTDCPLPENLDPVKDDEGKDVDREILILGCEDANLKNSDWDINDVVFLVYGNPIAPKKIEIKDGEIEESQSKRYMVEDLGATEETDIDFNDVVIDFKRTRKKKYTTVNGVIDDSKTTYTPWVSSATVKALGGTKDLSLYVRNGNTPDPTTDPCIFVKDLTRKNQVTSGVTVTYKQTDFATKGGLDATIMYNTVATNQLFENYAINYDKDATIAEIDLEGLVDSDGKPINQWDRDKDNFYIVVFEDNEAAEFLDMKSDGVSVLEFPEDGEVPAMIAVDPSQKWNYERYSVFKTSKVAGYYLNLKNEDTNHQDLNKK